MSETLPYALLHVEWEEEDRSWTITDATRPGFVVASHFLEDALKEVQQVLVLWDETAAANEIPRRLFLAAPATGIEVERRQRLASELIQRIATYEDGTVAAKGGYRYLDEIVDEAIAAAYAQGEA